MRQEEAMKNKNVQKNICPRCGQAKLDEIEVRNALSRRGDYYICSDCGTEEALEDAMGAGTFKGGE